MNPVYYFISALTISYLLIPAVKRIAERYNYFSHPDTDRWHKTPTPLFGGVAIYLAFIGTTLFFNLYHKEAITPFLNLLICSTLIFLLGLIDDIKKLPPQIKLVGQIIISAIAVFLGLQIEIITNPLISIPLTIFWFIAITNAFNLIDNMDGLSSGIAFISSIILFVFSFISGNTMLMYLTASIAGATLGFLRYNFNPAQIFMGDSGSMFLGFSLASVALMGTWQEASNLAVTLIIPVTVLAVPIFDTTLVTVVRRLKGIPVSQGGKDHTSHRLVMLGLSERKAVLILYGISVFFGLLAVTGFYLNIYITLLIVIIAMVILFFFGMFLGQIEVYERVSEEEYRTSDIEHKKNVTLIDVFLLNKKRLAEIFIDLILIIVAYFSAHLIRFEGVITSDILNVIKYSLPIIIISKFSMFYFFGLYRGEWRYIGIYDLISILKAVSLGSIVSIVAMVYFTRFSGLSRAVFVIDWMITLLLIGGARVSLRLFREYFSGIAQRKGKRILIYGAGDGGYLLLRELKNNSRLNYNPVGFIDDDRAKVGKNIYGIPVLGTRSDIADIIKEKDIEEVIIAMPSVSDDKIDDVYKLCKEMNVVYNRMASII